jgi:N-acetylglucosamine-6-phosphate deacetylase
VTPGIIDCHSHTGISGGVNEGAQAISAEVRIADVTDPDTVSWYRQLASGVTAVNSLHGSANAIGGQSQVNKIRWGCGSPDDMHMQGAAPGIKFALGENPKQSNWGDRAVTRYPQTRMGVETIIRDRFVAAREYAASRAAPGSRRDLELEAIAEILDGTRLVHCHAYRQDEILMLCRVAGEFGFRIGTFQHVLEGYKVADEIKAAAIGPSMFSDWWAFKMEVQDAVPYNGPIMHERGNVVSYNSDSDEMARRMHVEAGKAVRYSGPASPGASGGPPRIEPAEALKFITINPAIQLKIDARTGSLEAGKDADVAVFSGPPTSPLSRCVRTFVDGRELFSLEADAALRAADARERARLIQKALGVKDPAAAVASASAPASPAEPRPRPRRSLMERMAAQADDARREHYLSLYLRGLDPAFYRSGECGCESWMTGN